MRLMNRRTFISTSIAAALTTSRTSLAADTAHHIDRVGVQLYTVRGAMKSDFEGTIAKVAATGYKEVEFAGYFDHSPKDVRSSQRIRLPCSQWQRLSQWCLRSEEHTSE